MVVCVASSAVPRPPVPRLGPQGDAESLSFYSHNVAFGPLLPFPSPPCPAPLFTWETWSLILR